MAKYTLLVASSFTQKTPGKGMATHSSILAWIIPQTEEFGGYSPWDPKSQTRLSD